MELMILRMNETENEYYAGFNRHEWLAFDGGKEEYQEFLDMIGKRGDHKRGYFELAKDGCYYAIAFIDLKTAKTVDKKFGFEGSFVRAYKLRTVKE